MRPASGQVEITFSSFILGLSTQALLSLGEIPASPWSGSPNRSYRGAADDRRPLPCYNKKTSGNLDVGEEQMLENVLYDLRMRYVKLKREGRPA